MTRRSLWRRWKRARIPRRFHNVPGLVRAAAGSRETAVRRWFWLWFIGLFVSGLIAVALGLVIGAAVPLLASMWTVLIAAFVFKAVYLQIQQTLQRRARRAD